MSGSAAGESGTSQHGSLRCILCRSGSGTSPGVLHPPDQPVPAAAGVDRCIRLVNLWISMQGCSLRPARICPPGSPAGSQGSPVPGSGPPSCRMRRTCLHLSAGSRSGRCSQRTAPDRCPAAPETGRAYPGPGSESVRHPKRRRAGCGVCSPLAAGNLMMQWKQPVNGRQHLRRASGTFWPDILRIRDVCSSRSSAKGSRFRLPVCQIMCFCSRLFYRFVPAAIRSP